MTTPGMRQLLPVLDLVVITWLAGCGSAQPAGPSTPPRQVQRAHGSMLIGAVRYGDTCTATDEQFLDKAMHYGRTAATSHAFAQCMDAAIRNTYQQCNGDPFYGSDKGTQLASVMTAARSSVDVTINCSGGSGNASSGIDSYGQLTPETLSFSRWLQDGGEANASTSGPWPWSQAAGIVWHEAMHQQGYTHGADDQADAKVACGYASATDSQWHFQVNTMPYIVQNCISAVLDQSGTTCGAPLESGGGLNLVTDFGGATCAVVQDPQNASVTWQRVGYPWAAAKIAACSEGDGRVYAQNTDRSVWVNHSDGADSGWSYVTTPGAAQQIFCAGNQLWAFNDDRTLWRNDGTDQDVRWTYVGRPFGAKQVTGATASALLFVAPVLYALNDDNSLWRSSSGQDGSWTYVGKPWAAERIAAGGGLLEARPFALNTDKTLWLNAGDGCDAYWHYIDYPFAAAEITAASEFTLYALNTDKTLWKGKVNGSDWMTTVAFGHSRRCDGNMLVP